ncbi:hypothetical protein ACN47E_007087 [Coniothyrium glycines]
MAQHWDLTLQQQSSLNSPSPPGPSYLFESLLSSSGTPKPRGRIATSTQTPKPDLLTSLVFDRESVYNVGTASTFRSTVPSFADSTITAEPNLTVDPTHIEGDQYLVPGYGHGLEEEPRHKGRPYMLGHLQQSFTMAKVGKRRGLPTKPRLGKKERKQENVAPQKRPTDSASPARRRKSARTAANFQRKVNVKDTGEPGSNSRYHTVPAGVETIVISDDEEVSKTAEVNDGGTKMGRDATSNPQRPVFQPEEGYYSMIKVDSPEDDLDLDVKILPAYLLQNDTSLMESEHNDQVQQLRDKLRRVEEALTRNQSESHTILLAEQEKVRRVTKERDDLSHEVEILQARCDSLSAEQETLKRTHESIVNEHRNTLKSIAKNEETAAGHARQVAELEMEKAQLTKECELLRAISPSQTCPTILMPFSPAPSSPSSSSSLTAEEDKKAENLRKTYSKVKRRFDNLHAATMNLSKCTRGWDWSCHGEFGQYFQQMKAALEENGQDR